MRIIVTSDLHYDVARSKPPTEAVAREICSLGGDVLLLVGDSASADLRILDQAFGLFETFTGVRLATAGNHELWTANGSDSLHRYENELAQACSRNGVHYLDGGPSLLDGVAFVGSVGWYDYSFRPSQMNIPLRFYRHKIAPGAAAQADKYRHLLDGEEDLPPGALEITSRWMDGERVHLPMGDVEFTQLLAARLRHQLERVRDTADRVVAAIHHLPFAELVPHSVIPNWEFASCFLGSELLGETLLEFPNVSHVFCGHSHRAKRCRKGRLLCTVIGSTYREKHYEVLDL